MVKRWLFYLAVWSGCLLFYYANREWVSWMTLAVITLLPPLSLLLSLPMMLRSRMQVRMPQMVTVGQWVPVQIGMASFFPVPRWTVRLLAKHSLSGQLWRLAVDGDCPTEHCGTLQFHLSKGWIYDYLGLIRLPVRVPEDFSMTVWPKPCRIENLPGLDALISTAWRPKPGGGFSENHELRAYRPGDNLRQIHWKLSSKTGELIFREPLEPSGCQALLWLHLCGDANLLDKKLGQLLWLSGYLQRQGLKHDILAFTADGPLTFHISGGSTLRQAMQTLLSQRAMEPEQMPMPTVSAAWQYYIGGDENEAS